MKIQPTLTITADDNVYTVDLMNAQIKEMVALMDEWRQKEMDLSIDITMVRGALRDIQNQLLIAIRKEREEAIKKAQAMGVVQPESTTPESGGEA